MNYIGVIFIIILVTFILVYPFKVSVYNENQYLFINIAKIINLKLNLFILFDNNHNEDIKKQIKGLKVIKKVKFKEIDLKVSGLNWEYKLNGGYFGFVYAIFGFLYKLCELNDVELRYDFKYQGDKSLEFKSIFKARLGYVLTGFYSR